MRLFCIIFLIMGLFCIGCGKGNPDASAPVISHDMLLISAEGKAIDRRTGEAYSGLVVKHGPNGQRIAEFTLKDGTRNGPSREFHPDNSLKNSGTYKNNQLHGKYSVWFANGKMKMKGHFQAGIPTGIFHEWDESGKREWQIETTNGQFGNRMIVRNEEVKLAEAERKYLWDTEHHSALLRKYGFKPFNAALIERDGQKFAKKLSVILANDFSALLPVKNTGVRHEFGTASASRLEFKENDLKRGSGSMFTDWLLGEFSRFNERPRVNIHQMTFAPQQRAEIHGDWSGRVKLRAWGKNTKGGPEEITLYLDWVLNFPSEENLKAGHWLRECRVTRIKHASADKQLMRDVAPKAGLPTRTLHDNWKFGPDKTLANTGGIFSCDYNQDGISDLLITDRVPGPVPASLRHYLLKGTREGKMLDVTEEMGLKNARMAVVAFADLDGDGWVELITGQGQIFANHSGQRFGLVKSNLSQIANVIKHGSGHGISVADYDQDGRVDIYISRNDINRLEGTWVDGKIGPGAANKLFRNMGGWEFRDVTSTTGTDGGRRSTFTSAWLDANSDNRPDLYVINEYGNGILLVNRGGNRKFMQMELTDRASDFGSMGLTVGDFNNDGNVDLYVASMYSKSGSRVIGNLRPDAYDATTMRKLQRMVAGSQLYRNNGSLRFEPTGKQLDVVAVGWAYGPTLADLNNDGFLDIHATTGFISRTRDKPDG